MKETFHIGNGVDIISKESKPVAVVIPTTPKKVDRHETYYREIVISSHQELQQQVDLSFGLSTTLPQLGLSLKVDAASNTRYDANNIYYVLTVNTTTHVEKFEHLPSLNDEAARVLRIGASTEVQKLRLEINDLDFNVRKLTTENNKLKTESKTAKDNYTAAQAAIVETTAALATFKAMSPDLTKLTEAQAAKFTELNTRLAQATAKEQESKSKNDAAERAKGDNDAALKSATENLAATRTRLSLLLQSSNVKTTEEDIKRFNHLFGTGYVNEVLYGRQIIALITVNKQKLQQYNKFHGKAEATLPSNIAHIGTEGDFQREKINEDAIVDIKLDSLGLGSSLMDTPSTFKELKAILLKYYNDGVKVSNEAAIPPDAIDCTTESYEAVLETNLTPLLISPSDTHATASGNSSEAADGKSRQQTVSIGKQEMEAPNRDTGLAPHIKELLGKAKQEKLNERLVDIIFNNSEDAKAFTKALFEIGFENGGMTGSERKMDIRSKDNLDSYLIHLSIEELEALHSFPMTQFSTRSSDVGTSSTERPNSTHNPAMYSSVALVDALYDKVDEAQKLLDRLLLLRDRGVTCLVTREFHREVDSANTSVIPNATVSSDPHPKRLNYLYDQLREIIRYLNNAIKFVQKNIYGDFSKIKAAIAPSDTAKPNLIESQLELITKELQDLGRFHLVQSMPVKYENVTTTFHGHESVAQKTEIPLVVPASTRTADFYCTVKQPLAKPAANITFKKGVDLVEPDDFKSDLAEEASDVLIGDPNVNLNVFGHTTHSVVSIPLPHIDYKVLKIRGGQGNKEITEFRKHGQFFAEKSKGAYRDRSAAPAPSANYTLRMFAAIPPSMQLLDGGVEIPKGILPMQSKPHFEKASISKRGQQQRQQAEPQPEQQQQQFAGPGSNRG